MSQFFTRDRRSGPRAPAHGAHGPARGDGREAAEKQVLWDLRERQGPPAAPPGPSPGDMVRLLVSSPSLRISSEGQLEE